MSLAKKMVFRPSSERKTSGAEKRIYFLLLAFPPDIDSQALLGRGRKCSKVAQIQQVVGGDGGDGGSWTAPLSGL